MMEVNVLQFQPGNEFENRNEDKENRVDSKSVCDIESNHMNQRSKKKESEAGKRGESQKDNVLAKKNYNIKEIGLNLISLKDKTDNLAQKNDNNDTSTKKRGNKLQKTKITKNITYNNYFNYFSKEIGKIAFILISKTVINKKYKKLKNIIYMRLKYRINIDCIEKKIKDILSYKDENIKKIIDIIIEKNDYPPFIEFLNEYIRDLILCFSCNKINNSTKIYKKQLKLRYQALIKKLKNKGNSQEYIEYIEKCIKELLKAYYMDK